MDKPKKNVNIRSRTIFTHVSTKTRLQNPLNKSYLRRFFLLLNWVDVKSWYQPSLWCFDERLGDKNDGIDKWSLVFDDRSTRMDGYRVDRRGYKIAIEVWSFQNYTLVYSDFLMC